MTLGFIAAFIGIFVGLVAVTVLFLWLLESEYGDLVIGGLVYLVALAALGLLAWLITGALVSKG